MVNSLRDALCRLIWTAPLATALAGALLGSPGRADEPSKTLQPLLQQLEQGDFAERTRAEAQLFEQGEKAIPELTQAARNSPPELATRIVRILRRIYFSDTGVIGDRAEAALDELSRSGEVREAEDALQTIEDDREQRGMSAIAALGGKVRVKDGLQNGRIMVEVRIEAGWTGGVEGLKHLSRIPPARELMVTLIDGSGVPAEALEKIKPDHPWITIQERGAATLGIGPDSFLGGTGCVIGNVLAGNAADKAGIQVGDRIFAADDREIDNFDGLVKYLRTRKVDDEVALKVVRNGEILQMTAKLQSWKSIDNAIADGGDVRRRPPPFITPPTPRPIAPVLPEPPPAK